MTTQAKTTEPLTDEMIRALHREAVEHGDDEMADECGDALDARIDPGVRRVCRVSCAGAINAARAMDEARPYVAVVA